MVATYNFGSVYIVWVDLHFERILSVLYSLVPSLRHILVPKQ